MIKTEFFLGSNCSETQQELNEFLKSENVKYVDIKLATGVGQVICVLVYAEIQI